MPVLESGYSEYLFTIAQCYLGLGYSVLPVYGDLDIQRAKVCPIPWTYFQQRHASHTDLRNWFMHLGYGGLAIVCGRISGLIVLDFDDPALAQEFARRYPDLTETWTVQSGGRKLPHYYYRLPLHASIASQKREGVDLQSGGRYVVAPPTMTTTMEWRVLQGRQPRMLTERDLRRISAFVAVGASESQELTSEQPLFTFLIASNKEDKHTASQQPAEALVSGKNNSGKRDASSRTTYTSPSLLISEIKQADCGDADKLVSRYLKLAPSGRNEALFHTAVWARDHGWGEETVKHCLVDQHIRRLPDGLHQSETPEQRRKEATRTIESAFSRPPRHGGSRHSSGLISNAVRESLLKRKETATLRVLEAFTLAGWQPGRVFTEREAREVARSFTVGDWSVRKALRQIRLFDPPSANSATADENIQKPEYKKCFFVNQSKPTENKQRGRPARFYVMPDHKALCEKLGIEPAPGNHVAPEDLRSCRAYRQAVLRELIRRRPGHYSRDWLADLLGVSISTTRRYTQDASFVVTPAYHESPLLWRNLDSLIPPDIQDARHGSFLEDSNGKKYPPIRPIAKRLLGKSGFAWFKWRGVNHYAYAKSGETPPTPSAPEAVLSQADQHILNGLSSTTNRQPASSAPSAPAPMTPSKPPGVEKPSPNYTAPLDDARLEETARRVYDIIKQFNTSSTLSLANARALVTQYGAYAVENMVTVIQNRSDVRNTGGFLTQMLEAQHGFMTEDSLTIAEIYAAERAFLVTHEINPQRALSWQNACDLARQYGQVAIENAIKLLRQRNVKNPAGFMVRLLRSEPALASVHNSQPDEQFVEHVYNTLRQMNPQRALSRKMVRRIVAARGRQAVTDALHRIKLHGNVQNPAGLLVTMLRAQDLVRKQRPKRQPTRGNNSG
jgi:hypothetical protein